MRRSQASILILGLAALLTAAFASKIGLSGARATGSMFERAGRTLAGAGETLAGRALRRLLPAVAAAQEALDFKAVPRESVTQFERMRVVRRHGSRDDDTLESLPRSAASPPSPK